MNLLIVDDEKIICDGLQALVERLEIPEIESVRTAYTPRDALQIADHLRPEILLTDIRMPGKTGLELIAEIRDSQPDLRAIVVTGHDDFELVREALRLETIDYLLKPATRSELRRAVERAIGDINESRGRAQDRTHDDELYFDSIIEAAWPWFAEGIQLSPDTIRRLSSALSDRIGRDHLAVVAIECCSGSLDQADALLERAARPQVTAPGETAGAASERGTLILVTRREPNAVVAVAGGTTKQAVSDLVGVLTRTVPRDGTLHFAGSGPSQGLYSLPLVFRGMRLARIAGLGDDHSSHVVAVGGPEPFDSSLPARAQAILDAASTVASSEEVAQMIRQAAATPRVLEGIWSEIERLVLRSARMGNELAAIETFQSAAAAAQAIRAAIAPGTRGESEHGVIQKAREFVAAHFHEQHTMHDVAERLGLSYAYFSTLFKDHTGETFSHFLIRTRMEHARRLLDEIRLPISEVAGRVGYLYPRHFSRAFKGFYGMTPQQYLSGAPVSRDTEPTGESHQK